jgi:2-methylaconitate cis-trans-isomerase PrpF
VNTRYQPDLEPERDLTAVPCILMRGGTSRGPFFLESDLPADPKLRDRVLLAAMGSPDRRQIDGLGGAHPLTSKVAARPPASISTSCSPNCSRTRTR